MPHLSRTTLWSPTQVLTFLLLHGVFFGSVVDSQFVTAQDTSWPQWRGPNRDGHAAPQTLLKQWPAGGPKLAWESQEAGLGFSASTISNGRLFTMGAKKGECLVICLDAKTGKSLWQKPIDGVAGDSDYNLGWGGGPRSSPTIVGDVLYALSDLGTLSCLKTSNGDSVWSVNLVKDFGGSIPKWGYSESVLVDGERVIVMPGGKNFLIGLDAKSGKKIWGSVNINAPANYVSAVKANLGGRAIYVTASAPGLMGIDAKNGELLFENSSTGNKTAVIPTPIVSGDLVYHVSAYGAGNVALQVSANNGKIAADQLYHNAAKSMENHHGGVVLHDGTIFGFSKLDGGVWMAQDLKSGNVLWSQKVGRDKSGSITFADGMLYCYSDTEGACYLIEASRNGWSLKGELTLPAQTKIPRGKGAIWSHPIVSDGVLYIRDQDLIYAYAIAG